MYYLKGKTQSPLPRLKDYSQSKQDKLKTFFHPERSLSNTARPGTERLEQNKINNESNQMITEYHGDIVEVIIPKKQTKKKCNIEKIMPRLFTKPKILIFDEVQSKEEESVNFETDSIVQARESQELDEHNIKFDQNGIRRAVVHINNKITNDMDEYFFSFIKNQEKLKDIVENFANNQLTNTHPGHFYCKNDTLFPKKIDVSTCLKDEKLINFMNLHVNSNYYPLIQSLLNKQQNMKSLTFQGSRLTDKLLLSLIKHFPPILKDLNLKDNQLGQRGASILAENLPKFLNLKQLNLSNNMIGDKGAQFIIKALHKNPILSKLNLSENTLSEELGQSIYDLLINSQGIEILIVNWNQLGSNAGSFIAKGLLLNKSLKVLDLSYNHLGQNEKSNCIQLWCQALQNPQLGLVHLDLSYNQFQEAQLKQFNQALQKNNSLYGFHIEGNKCQGIVDAYGFIQFQSDNTEFRFKKYPIDGVNYIPELGQCSTQNCCWICQGWAEHRFQFTPGQDFSESPIFLHLDFLKYVILKVSYKPIPMTSNYELKQQLIEQQKELQVKKDQQIKTTKQETQIGLQVPQNNNPARESGILSKEVLEELSKFCYSTYQMCPPKQKILYFFSNPVLEQYFVEPTEDYMQSPVDDLILSGKDPKHQFHYFSDGTILKFKKITHVNYLFTKQEFIIDDKNNYKSLIRIFPRSSEKKYVLKRIGHNLTRNQINFSLWNIEDSIFKQQFQGDNEALLNDSFLFDWNCSKINRFVKNEYEQMKLKEYLRENYELIKDIYKFFASQGYFQFECFCIPFSLYTKLMLQIGIIDNDNVKVQDVEIDLISIKNNIDQKYLQNPEKSLVRYQFLEMFFRLANDKYVRTNIVKNHADAVYRLLKEFKEYFMYFDTCQQWREKRFWNKECESLIKFKEPFLKKLYDYVTDISSRKWYFKMKWIAIKEFRDFCKQMGLMEYVSEKQILIIYNFSMMTQIDEVNQDRNVRMSLIEFSEALARLAEIVSPGPIGEMTEFWQPQRFSLPLHVKLETLLTHIFYNIIKKSHQFTIFFDLFAGPQRFDWLPKPKTQKKEKEEELVYINTNEYLTLYNTIKYCGTNLIYIDLHKQPYLNPNFKIFLKKSSSPTMQDFTRRSTLLSPKSPIQGLRMIKKSGFVDEPKVSPPPSPRLRSPSFFSRKQQNK